MNPNNQIKTGNSGGAIQVIDTTQQAIQQTECNDPLLMLKAAKELLDNTIYAMQNDADFPMQTDFENLKAIAGKVYAANYLLQKQKQKQ